jgi:hypothetical protein
LRGNRSIYERGENPNSILHPTMGGLTADNIP